MDGGFETTVSALSESAAVPQLRFWQRPTAPALITLCTAAVVGLGVWSVMRPESRPLVRFSISPDEAVPLHLAVGSHDIAISPTGEHIAYLTGTVRAGAKQLHVRSLDQLRSETLVSGGGELNAPFFSPDGEWVGFYDRSTPPNLLKRVSVRGGPISTICALPSDLRGASWGTDGTIVFADATSQGLWRVASSGGVPERLTTPDPDRGEVLHHWPEILPGGEAVLFTILSDSDDSSQIAALRLDTGEQRVLIRGGSYPRYAPTGHLLYGLEENLWAVRFDASRLETVGDPVLVLEGVHTKPVFGGVVASGAANFGVSATGSLGVDGVRVERAIGTKTIAVLPERVGQAIRREAVANRTIGVRRGIWQVRIAAKLPQVDVALIPTVALVLSDRDPCVYLGKLCEFSIETCDTKFQHLGGSVGSGQCQRHRVGGARVG